jgi:hypothetical protein
LDPVAAAALADRKNKIAWEGAAAARAAAAAAAAAKRGRVTVPGSCLSSRPPSRQQQQQQQQRSGLASRSSVRHSVSRGASMFLTGEEEEEWNKDAVEGAEEPCAEVSAVTAAALAAAAAEAAKYQSLIDIEERRFDLLQVHIRFFKYSQTSLMFYHPRLLINSPSCFVLNLLLLYSFQLISSSGSKEGDEGGGGVAEKYVRACVQR